MGNCFHSRCPGGRRIRLNATISSARRTVLGCVDRLWLADHGPGRNGFLAVTARPAYGGCRRRPEPAGVRDADGFELAADRSSHGGCDPDLVDGDPPVLA